MQGWRLVNPGDLLDLAVVDWSRRWVRARAIVIASVLVFAPSAVLRFADWYGETKAEELVKLLVPPPRDAHEIAPDEAGAKAALRPSSEEHALLAGR